MTEQMADNNIEWSLSKRDIYSRDQDGRLLCLTLGISCVVRTATNLATMFFAIIMYIFFENVVTCTDKYIYNDWVIEKNEKIKTETRRKGNT